MRTLDIRGHSIVLDTNDNGDVLLDVATSDADQTRTWMTPQEACELASAIFNEACGTPES